LRFSSLFVANSLVFVMNNCFLLCFRSGVASEMTVCFCETHFFNRQKSGFFLQVTH